MTATYGLTGKVAFITGIARGQGRAHAARRQTRIVPGSLIR